MSPYVSVAAHRRTRLRDVLVATSDTHDMPLTVKHMGFLATAVTDALFPDDRYPDSVLQACDLEPDGGEVTDRELTTFRHLANGLTVKQTAAVTGWGIHPVRHHVRCVFAKLGAHNITHAVWILTTSGQLPGEDDR